MHSWPENKVQRVLEWYKKDPGDALVGEELLVGINLNELRLLFGVEADDTEDPLMFQGYAVGPQHAKTIQQFVGVEIDMEAFDYYVASYQEGA